jgi:hypothetical protein
MHFAYSTRLFILVLCSKFEFVCASFFLLFNMHSGSFSCIRSQDEHEYHEENEENEHTSTIGVTSTTTESFSLIEPMDGHYHDVVVKPIETTTTVKKTTQHDFAAHDDDGDNFDTDDDFDDHEDDSGPEKVSTTTYKITTAQSSPSSYSKGKLSTSAIIETTTSKREIPVTHSISPVSRVFYHGNELSFLTTAIDYTEVAAFIAKASRRLTFVNTDL